MNGGVDGCALRGFGACAPAAALRLKVAQAAFSERALWVVRAGAECLCEFAFFASSPQPALVRVAVRGQPAGHLASGGGADGSEKATEAGSSGGGGVEEVDLEEKGNEKEEADLGESVRELWATGE